MFIELPLRCYNSQCIGKVLVYISLVLYTIFDGCTNYSEERICGITFIHSISILSLLLARDVEQ